MKLVFDAGRASRPEILTARDNFSYLLALSPLHIRQSRFGVPQNGVYHGAISGPNCRFVGMAEWRNRGGTTQRTELDL
jgi:hypothetical protein